MRPRLPARARSRAVPAALSVLTLAVLTLAVLALAVFPALLAAPAHAAEVPSIVINEIETDTDWIELTNAGEAPVDISGFLVKDDADDHIFVVPADTILAAGGFYTADVNATEDGFGLGRADSARVFTPDGTLLDSYSWTDHPSPSYGRCADATGEFITTVAVSKNAANICTLDPADAVVINEIESSQGDPGDWVELYNTATVTADVSGLRVLDADDDHVFAIPAGTTIAADGYLVIEEADLGFGLGDGDSVRLTDASGTTMIDTYSWTEHASTTYGRCPEGVGEFALTATATKGAANDCVPPVASASLMINEVESNGDDTDWVELMNIGADELDLSGYTLLDNDPTHPAWVLPAGSVVAPGALFVIDQASGSTPGFDFGLGADDEVRLFAPDGVTLVTSYAWTMHASVTYGRCPDGVGELGDTTVSTKGAANNCAMPVKINEVESQPATGEDWVELVNVGSTMMDASGLIIRDNDDTHTYALPADTTIAPGEFLAVDTLGFGLGGEDGVRLFAADGVTLLDAYAWTSHAATTYGRCPDPSGPFETTQAESKSTQNICEGVVLAEPWLGGSEVRTVDTEATFAGDLSGLDWEPSGSAALGTLWAVQNGDGLLYRLVADADGTFAPDAADGWSDGKTLRYPDGTGTVDAEGVTVVGDDSAGGVYVSSERNNDASSTSRPAVLRFDASGSSTELTATQEWNLAADFAGLAANSGLEGITWVPDAFLTEGGFADAITGSAYDPADYPGHGAGLFFVGVEGTASVYAYALQADGEFARIATLATTFALVADVQFDADLGALWVLCDEACDGRNALYELDDATGAFAAARVFERPTGMANIANEGFAVADDAVCVDGAKPTFYADDADTDGFSLREGTLPCEVIGGPGEPSPEPTQPPVGGENPDAGEHGTDVRVDALAATGVDASVPIVLGMLLLGVGVAAVAVRRRKMARD